MFRFTLSGRVLRKLVYIGHTNLMIEADAANASLVSCIVRDERLKEIVDCTTRTGSSVRIDGAIEWHHTITPNSACCFFHFAAESVAETDEGACP